MRYANPQGKTQELRRLWEVEVYVGDKEAKKRKTQFVTVVAFNAVEAIRLCGGRAVTQPIALHYVTWPESDGGPIHRIASTSGPVDRIPVEPMVTIVDPPKPKPKTRRVKRKRFNKKAK